MVLTSHGPLSITPLAHLWNLQMDLRLMGSKQRLETQTAQSTKTGLCQTFFLKLPGHTNTIKKLLFTAVLKVFRRFCCSLFRVKVFRIENTISLKCYRSEARLCCFHILALSKMNNGNKKKEIKIFERLTHSRSVAFKLPALSFKFVHFTL